MMMNMENDGEMADMGERPGDGVSCSGCGHSVLVHTGGKCASCEDCGGYGC